MWPVLCASRSGAGHARPPTTAPRRPPDNADERAHTRGRQRSSAANAIAWTAREFVVNPYVTTATAPA